jgi:UDPglucose 6-dehydrogenase
MIKYASNAFLATRISFINEIANTCEALGADVKEVAVGMGYDKRIGHHFLDAGVGYGGSCFPKDVKALSHMASVHGKHPQLLQAVMDINNYQRRAVMLKLRELLGDLNGKTVGLLGLAFKPNTDDMRDAPAVTIADMLIHEGATVRAYDPVAGTQASRLLKSVELADGPYAVAEQADALVVVTEWNEFKQLDMERVCVAMRQPILVDGRNIYDPVKMRAMGFTYRGIGRGYNGAGWELEI